MATTLLSELLTIDINRDCANQEIQLRWLNSVGGWEYWTFSARKTYGYEISDVETIERDVFENWDTTFIAGGTESEHLSMKVRQSIEVRSQNLTKQQVDAISKIKFSLKVEDVTNGVTVLVENKSFEYRTDQDKIHSIDFTIIYPQTFIQSL